jgi:hypothetical protein
MLPAIERMRLEQETQKSYDLLDSHINEVYTRIAGIARLTRMNREVSLPTITIKTNGIGGTYGLVEYSNVAERQGHVFHARLGFPVEKFRIGRPPYNSVYIESMIPRPGGGQKNEKYIITKAGDIYSVGMFQSEYILFPIPDEEIPVRVKLLEEIAEGCERKATKSVLAKMEQESSEWPPDALDDFEN